MRVALVTGAARGIGFAIAKSLASRGMHVVLVDKLDAVRDSASALSALGASAEGRVADIASEPSVRALVSDIDSRHHRCDILVNNAAISPKHEGLKRETVDTPTSEWSVVLRVNLTAPFLLCRECLPLMQRGEWGRIVNISGTSRNRVASVEKIGFNPGQTESTAPGQAWTACGRPTDRVDNAKSCVAHTRPQPAHPRPERASSPIQNALRA